jgi:hypothetical protein
MAESSPKGCGVDLLKMNMQVARSARFALNLSILAAAITLSLSVAAMAKENLLCVADKSTGFSWNGSEWISSDFRVSNLKLLVKSVDEYKFGVLQVNYEVSEFGSTSVKYHCHRDEGSDQMSCGGLGWGIVVNFSALRFQDFYGIGFVDGPDKPGNTPALTIGYCQKL